MARGFEPKGANDRGVGSSQQTRLVLANSPGSATPSTSVPTSSSVDRAESSATPVTRATVPMELEQSSKSTVGCLGRLNSSTPDGELGAASSTCVAPENVAVLRPAPVSANRLNLFANSEGKFRLPLHGGKPDEFYLRIWLWELLEGTRVDLKRCPACINTGSSAGDSHHLVTATSHGPGDLRENCVIVRSFHFQRDSPTLTMALLNLQFKFCQKCHEWFAKKDLKLTIELLRVADSSLAWMWQWDLNLLATPTVGNQVLVKPESSSGRTGGWEPQDSGGDGTRSRDVKTEMK